MKMKNTTPRGWKNQNPRKTNCVSCNAELNSKHSYENNGNYCSSCNAKAGMIAELRTKIQNPEKNKAVIRKILKTLKEKYDLRIKDIEGQEKIIKLLKNILKL